jgi:hypothetical protein
MFAAYVGCVPGCRDVSGWPIGRIEQAVSPTEDQRHLLDDLANASFRAAQVIKETCPTSVSFAPTGRLDAMQKRMEGMVQAIDIAGPPLDKFYASLTDEQKARLDAANEHTGRSNSLANCGAASSATRWPGDRIEPPSASPPVVLPPRRSGATVCTPLPKETAAQDYWQPLPIAHTGRLFDETMFPA